MYLHFVLSKLLRERAGASFPHYEEETSEEFFEKEDEIEPLMSESTAARRWRVIQELDFSSLSDVMNGHDIDEKRGAVEKLCRLRTPESLKLLMTFRNDPHPDVRFFVTSALERVKRDYEQEFDAAHDEMKKDAYKASARLFLAQKYIEYMNSGLLDEVLANQYFEESLFHLKTILQGDHPLEAAYWLLLEQYRSASVAKYETDILAVIESLRKKTSDRERLARVEVDVLFALGRYGELRRCLETVARFPEKNPEWTPLLYWWGISV